jgi:hypothetical protein
VRKIIYAAAVLLLAGCGASASAGAAPAAGTAAGRLQAEAGTVTGHLQMEGGPIGPGGAQPSARPIPGTVQFASGQRQVALVRVGSSGAFSVPLPAGTYRVSGRSPRVIEVSGGRHRELPCAPPRSVTVTAGHTAALTLSCIVP